MLNSIVPLVLFSAIFSLSVNGKSYNEKYRLQVHYSVKSAWSNDPNGLIYAGGYYQLFYQHNPNSTVFGQISWGHARSKDLIRWENLPIALKPYDEKSQIFSGCCVIDENNVTGFASNCSEKAPLIAFYTLKEIGGAENEDEEMAYSLDDGITWTRYVNNPVIPNPGLRDFRDPNVFERDGTFYMTLVVGDRIRFMSSANLKSWHFESDFGVDPEAGDKSGVWECPSMVTLKDDQGHQHDVLVVSVNGDEVCFTQYFVGKFNGSHFINYNQSNVLLFDNGFDNYASVPYLNDPLGRILSIGWMSNWLYAQKMPTTTWRGQMTIPRELTLKTVDGKKFLAQQPILELNKLIDPLKCWSLSQPMKISGYQTLDLTEQIPFELGPAYTLEFVYDIGNVTNGNFSIRFSNRLEEFILFTFDLSGNTFEFDRRKSGNASFNTRFHGVTRFNRISDSSIFKGKVILDTTSIEHFFDDGLHSLTALFFPTETFNKIQLFTAFENTGESLSVLKLSLSHLNSIWTEPQSKH